MEHVLDKYGIDYKDGIVNRGNLGRLKKCMERAQQGEKLTLGFIGGSITQGSLASTPETCYAYLVFRWWTETFPQAEFTYVNAGVGGTTSQFGVARVQEDLLRHKPDFVIVEFSVNDEDEEHFAETYEGLVRKIYGSGFAPAVLLVHNVRYDTGINAENRHRKIGKAYHLPSVSMKPTIYRKVEEGKLPAREITPDDLHPNDEGHALVAGVIRGFLGDVYAQREETEDGGEAMGNGLPEAVTPNAYEHSVRYRNDNCEPDCEGFVKDTDDSAENTEKNFRKGWTASSINDRIVFKVEGTEIAVQYRKSVRKPAPVARVTVDGDGEHAHVLDGNFGEDWGDCLYIDTVAERLENRVHEVEITIVEGNAATDGETAGKEVAVPFYLVSVIGSR